MARASGNRKENNERQQWIAKYEKILSEPASSFLDIEIFEDMASYFLEEAGFDKALRTCNIALEQYPFSAEMHILRAHALVGLQRLPEAMESLEASEAYQPNSLDSLLLRSSIMMQKENYTEALLLLEQALEQTDEQSDDIYFYMGMTLHHQQQTDKAIACYKKALQSNPRHEMAGNELLLCLEDEDRLSEAITFFAELTNEDAFNVFAWLNLASAYNQSGDYENAFKACEYASLIEEDNEDVQFEMGCIYMNLRQYDKALECFGNILEDNPSDVEVMVHTGACYEKLLEYDRAIYYYRKVLKVSEQVADAWFGLGTCMASQERYQSSIYFFKKALALNDSNSEYWYESARAEFESGNILFCRRSL